MKALKLLIGILLLAIGIYLASGAGNRMAGGSGNSVGLKVNYEIKAD